MVNWPGHTEIQSMSFNCSKKRLGYGISIHSSGLKGEIMGGEGQRLVAV